MTNTQARIERNTRVPTFHQGLSEPGARLARGIGLALILCMGCLGAMDPAHAQAKGKRKVKEMAPKEVTFESPAQGTIARPGSSVVVRVSVDPSLKASRVSLLIGTWNELISFVDDAPPYVFPVSIDRRWSGPLRISCSAQSQSGRLIASGELLVNVVPSDPPVSISVTDPVRMTTRRAANAPPEHINVRGTYADGTVRDVGRSELGTSFHSNDPQVVIVDSEGFLTAKNPGRAVVTVKNGELSALVPVQVQPGRNQPLPPVEVTGQVELRVDPVQPSEPSHRRAQQVLIKNVSTSAIHLPVELVVTDLPAGVELLNPSGKTQVVMPIGSALAKVEAAGPDPLLAPGDTVTARLEFSAQGDALITPSLRVFSGSQL